jgi:hypothetical protein
MIDVCSGCGLHLAEDAGAIVAVVEDDDFAPVMFGLCAKCAELQRDLRILLRYPAHLEREAANGIIVTRLHNFVVLLRWKDEAHFRRFMADYGTR